MLSVLSTISINIFKFQTSSLLKSVDTTLNEYVSSKKAILNHMFKYAKACLSRLGLAMKKVALWWINNGLKINEY